MPELSRRALIVGATVLAGAPLTAPAFAQSDAPQGGAAPPFGFQDVVKRARDLAAAPYDASVPALPDGLANLDYDAWRDIRFKSDKPLLGQQLNANFRLELFHLGHLYKRPVVVNVLRDGIPAPIPYAANLFDYGRNKFADQPADQPRLCRLPPANFRSTPRTSGTRWWPSSAQAISASSAAASATASRRAGLPSAAGSG